MLWLGSHSKALPMSTHNKCFYGEIRNKRPMGHGLLTWVKQSLPICRCHAIFFQSTRTQIWLYHKKVKSYSGIFIWTNLIDLDATNQDLFLFLDKKIFKCFLTYSTARVVFQNPPPEPVGSGFEGEGLNFSIPRWFHLGRWIRCVPTVKITW